MIKQHPKVNRRGDSARIVVDNHDKADLTSLGASDTLLRNIANRWSGPVYDCIPNFRYWDLGDVRHMTHPQNVTGHQQRAFDFYWTIRCGLLQGGVNLGIGTTVVPGPCTLGTDKHGKDNPPPDPRYTDTRETHERGGISYSDPMFFLDADEPFPFSDDSFDCVMANHVLEHMRDVFATLDEMLRVCKPAGMVCLVMPDMTFSRRGSIDPLHTREFAADEWHEELVKQRPSLRDFHIVEHNTLDNSFSFNTVLQKK